MTDRTYPTTNPDEHTNLTQWLDFHRATLISKTTNLTEDQLRTPAIPPSEMTLLGLLQHLTEVERTWFARVPTAEDLPALYGQRSEDGHDGGFELSDTTYPEAKACWEAQVSHSQATTANHNLDDSFTWQGMQLNLRWILTHMIGEYARHLGHADLLRERLDGSTGF